MATNTAKAQAAFNSAAKSANQGLASAGQAINSVSWGDYSYVFPAFLFGLSAYVLLATIKIFYGLRDDCENETLIRTVYTLSVVSSFLTGWLGTIQYL